MAALVCEICGGKLVGKAGGVFVCDSCGMEYDKAWAQEKIQEIKGTVQITGNVDVSGSTVKVDESEKRQKQIGNYLEMAESAFNGTDIDGTVTYCDKVLEIDPDNYRAWTLRAKSAGWNSSLQNIKIPQAVTASKKAVSLAPDTEKYTVAADIYSSVKSQIFGLLETAKKMPNSVSSPGPKYMHEVMMMWLYALQNIPCLSAKLLENEINNCQIICKNAKSSFLPQDRYLFAAYIGHNSGTRYDKTFSAALSNKIIQERKREQEIKEKAAREAEQKRKALEAEKKKKLDAYWAEHPDEKKELESKKTKLLEKVSVLKKQIDNLQQSEQKTEIQKKIDSLQSAKSSLGLFKSKEKKELQDKIDALEKQLSELNGEIKAEIDAINAEITARNKKISSIVAELTKER